MSPVVRSDCSMFRLSSMSCEADVACSLRSSAGLEPGTNSPHESTPATSAAKHNGAIDRRKVLETFNRNAALWYCTGMSVRFEI